jgi:hypothetical protein
MEELVYCRRGHDGSNCSHDGINRPFICLLTISNAEQGKAYGPFDGNGSEAKHSLHDEPVQSQKLCLNPDPGLVRLTTTAEGQYYYQVGDSILLTNIAVCFSSTLSSSSLFPPPVKAIPSIPVVEMMKSGCELLEYSLSRLNSRYHTIATTIDQSSGPHAFRESRT